MEEETKIEETVETVTPETVVEPEVVVETPVEVKEEKKDGETLDTESN